MNEITEEQALNRLRAKVGYRHGIGAVAKEFKISQPFMSRVLAGKDPMTEPMLKDIGVQRMTKFYDAIEA